MITEHHVRQAVGFAASSGIAMTYAICPLRFALCAAIATLALACAPPIASPSAPSLAVCTMPDAPAHVSEALDVAIDAWAQAGVPIHRGTPKGGCDARVIGDAGTACSDRYSYGCEMYGTVHVYYDIPTQRDPYIRVLTHELGHLLGAGHVEDPHSVMWWALLPADAYASDPARGLPVDDAALAALELSAP